MTKDERIQALEMRLAELERILMEAPRVIKVEVPVPYYLPCTLQHYQSWPAPNPFPYQVWCGSNTSGSITLYEE